MRIAAHVLAYNVTRFLKPVLENMEPHVDRIYIAYPERPFGYNPSSRQTKTNPTKLTDIHAASSSSKIEIITGDWATEDEMRNACLARAREEGLDWFITQDADEFYTEDSWRQIKRMLHQNKTDDHFTTTWYNFWKSSHYAICDMNGSIKSTNAGFAIRCSSKIKFSNRRLCDNTKKTRFIDFPCYHYGYVMSDKEMLEKLATWSHADMIFNNSWYNCKWIYWTEATRWLDPVFPWTSAKAIPFPLDQPDFAEDFAIPVVQLKPNFKVFVADTAFNMSVNLLLKKQSLARLIRSLGT